VDYDEFDEARIKHLEFIQAVITRLGNDGFLTRGWALTVAGAFLGFAVNTRNRWLAIASMVPTLGFWWLDGFFLRAERLFRKLYGRVRARDERVEPFFMSATSNNFIEILDEQERQDVKHWRVLLRPALLGLYLLLLAAAVLVFIIVIYASPSTPSRKHP
jgi:RsiW-degrading membrane proteinase PrsW (M82 family)